MQRTLLTNEFDSLCSTFIYILYTISVSISRIIWRGGVIFNINSVFIEEREERERERENVENVDLKRKNITIKSIVV